jgi:hypothetical protein
MRQLLSRFSLEAAKFNWQVFLCLLVIWAVLVCCAVISINSQGFSQAQRRVWLWVVTCVPLFGLLVYLPFSIRRDDLPQIILLMLQKDRLTKKNKKAPLPKGGRSA